MHPIRVVVVAALTMVALAIWAVSTMQERLTQTAALKGAELYSEAVSEFRTLYTSEVVRTARQHGMEITHDYENTDGAIPLPATLSMLLGNRLGERGSGAKMLLYSPHPFPWRKDDGGLRDSFAKEAWQALSQNGSEPFYRFEIVGGRRSLRYATADVMRTSCVHCHNTHAQSPKTDWQVGNLRGVLEVIYPLDEAVAAARTELRGTIFLLVVVGATGLGGLVFLVGRWNRGKQAGYSFSSRWQAASGLSTVDLGLSTEAAPHDGLYMPRGSEAQPR